MTNNTKQSVKHCSTNSDIKKKRKKSNKTSVKVIKDGKVMIKKKKRRSSNKNKHSHKNVTPMKVTKKELKEQAHKKIVKRLSTAAILIGTLGLSTTAIALSQTHQKPQEPKSNQHLIVKEYTPDATYSDAIKEKDDSSKKEEPTVEESHEEEIDNSLQQEPEEIISSSNATDYQEQTETSATVEPIQEPEYRDEKISDVQPEMTLNILGQLIHYQNGGQSAGQSVIDANSESMASTWGGSSVFSGSDGMNTHFIGHNPGAFSVIFSLSIGNQISVTDGIGSQKNYIVNSIRQVYDDGTDVNSGEALFDSITGTGGGERITLQSCINDDCNLIIFASAL